MRKSKPCTRTLRSCLILAAFTSIAAPLPANAFFHDASDIERGCVVYAENCASCHGGNLEGQPDWQSARADGTYPAPPHDETGHTWHHGDAMLLDYIRRGGQAVLDDMGVEFTSGMPAFTGILSDDDIEAVLEFIKSTWPDTIRLTQEERSRADALSP